MSKPFLMICFVTLGMGLVSSQASGTSDNLVAYFVPSKMSATSLSPSNSGTGLGLTISLVVQNSSNWFAERISSNNFFGKSSVTFQGKGFAASLPATGTDFLTIELEGPNGLLPDICWRASTQQSSETKVLDGGTSCEFGGVLGGRRENMSPLVGSGTIVNETLVATYGGNAQQVAGSNNIYVSLMFGSTNGAYVGSTVFVHYGGGTTNSTDYIRIGP